MEGINDHVLKFIAYYWGFIKNHYYTGSTDG